MIQFSCPHCRHPFRTQDDNAGKKTKCPKCAAVIVIPGAGPAGAPAPSPAPAPHAATTAPPPPVTALARPAAPDEAPAPRGRGLRIVLALLVVAILGGGGFAAWHYLPGIIQKIAEKSKAAVESASNESITPKNMKDIAEKEKLFLEQVQVDQDDNGKGEYGLLGEMAGELALRPGKAKHIKPSYISQEFKTGGNMGDGWATVSGYRYRVYLSNATTVDPWPTGCDKDLGGNTTTGGPGVASEATAQQQKHYAVYAWPEAFKKTGATAFFVNEAGKVYTTRMEAKTYDGAAAPAANAAYIKLTFTGRISSGTTPGNDGNKWAPGQ